MDAMGLGLPEIEAPVEAAFKGSFMPWQFERQVEKLDAIGPILATAKKSAERTAAYAAAATQPSIIRGKVTFYAEKTLREWVTLYESGGPAALMPRARGGRGHARVLITRAWDAGIDLADDQKAIPRNRCRSSSQSVARRAVPKASWKPLFAPSLA